MCVYMYTIHRVGMKDDTGGLQVDVSVSCIERFKHATIISVRSLACVAKGLNRVCVWMQGVEIPYNPKSGNWFIAKWSKIDKE